VSKQCYHDEIDIAVLCHFSYVLNTGEIPVRRDAMCIVLHSRKHFAVRKSASSARNEDEETTAKIEIYAPRSRAWGNELTIRVHDSGNTRRRRVVVVVVARRSRSRGARVSYEKLRAGTSEFYVWHFVAEVCRLVVDSPWKNSSVVSLQTFCSFVCEEHRGSPPPPPSSSRPDLARARIHFFPSAKKFSGKTPLNILLA